MRPLLTPDIIRAASWDAGNLSARKAGRTRWNEDDVEAALTEQERLWDLYEAPKDANDD